MVERACRRATRRPGNDGGCLGPLTARDRRLGHAPRPPKLAPPLAARALRDTGILARGSSRQAKNGQKRAVRPSRRAAERHGALSRPAMDGGRLGCGWAGRGPARDGMPRGTARSLRALGARALRDMRILAPRLEPTGQKGPKTAKNGLFGRAGGPPSGKAPARARALRDVRILAPRLEPTAQKRAKNGPVHSCDRRSGRLSRAGGFCVIGSGRQGRIHVQPQPCMGC